MPSIVTLAAEMLAIINNDHERLIRIDDYLHGRHDDPYMPQNADGEYRLLATRAISNWMPLLVGTPAQALYVDSFRPSRSTAADAAKSPEWEHWQESRLDARQQAVHRGALAYGHSFTLTEKLKSGKIRTKGLSPLRTAALYEDAANDYDPYAALHILSMPSGKTKGKARVWDGKREYQITFEGMLKDQKIQVLNQKSHGAPECPVTRFAAQVDLEGRTLGVIEPLIPIQNRINQTVFDLLVAQTYGSFKVRWVTGMAPPMELVPGWVDLDGNPVPQGTPGAVEGMIERPVNIDHNARRFLFAEDDNVKFGSLDETPLDGFISSIEMSVKHLSAIAQVPPHHLLGQIANLSAEALQAAETSLSRMVESFRKSFGESWERVFRLAGALAGDESVYSDESGEVLWRDMEQRSLAQSADALGKLSESLQIPKRGLWSRVPDVTQNEIDYWNELRDEDNLDGQMVDALHRASAPGAAATSTRTIGNLDPKLG
jgi:hypothetical protein